MKRNIIEIDQEKCNGCGICVEACHEGAIQMIDGKAQLVTESYCDGLGDCLPECPTGAITMQYREAPAYDEEAVKENMKKMKEQKAHQGCSGGGCPGSQSKTLKQEEKKQPVEAPVRNQSELMQWPVQIKLVPINAPYFDGAKLLIAADCTAFASANIHSDYMKGKITLIGCPKLDMEDYSIKLAEIIRNNDIKSISVLRMTVPCCGGMVQMVKKAIIDSGKMLPWNVTVIAPNGEVVED